MVPRNSHKENNLFAIIDTRILLIQMHPYIVQQHVPSNSNYDRRSGQEHALKFLMIICHMVTQPAPKEMFVCLFIYLCVSVRPPNPLAGGSKMSIIQPKTIVNGPGVAGAVL